MAFHQIGELKENDSNIHCWIWNIILPSNENFKFPFPDVCRTVELVNVLKASVIPVRRSFITFPIRWVSLIIESAITLIDDGTSARGTRDSQLDIITTLHTLYSAVYTVTYVYSTQLQIMGQ